MEEKTKISFSISVLVAKDTKGYHAYIPALKGLHTCGDTPNEAADNAAQAAIAYIKSLLKHNEPIPILYQIDIEQEPDFPFVYDEAFTREIAV